MKSDAITHKQHYLRALIVFAVAGFAAAFAPSTTFLLTLLVLGIIIALPLFIDMVTRNQILPGHSHYLLVLAAYCGGVGIGIMASAALHALIWAAFLIIVVSLIGVVLFGGHRRRH